MAPYSCSLLALWPAWQSACVHQDVNLDLALTLVSSHSDRSNEAHITQLAKQACQASHAERADVKQREVRDLRCGLSEIDCEGDRRSCQATAAKDRHHGGL